MDARFDELPIIDTFDFQPQFYRKANWIANLVTMKDNGAYL